MAVKQDGDLKEKSIGALRREVMRLREKIRWHRDREENQRCHHCDLELYGVLPEEKPPGKMTESEEVILRKCRQYIRRQQCALHGCTESSTTRKLSW
jgi:hypothetical protein